MPLKKICLLFYSLLFIMVLFGCSNSTKAITVTTKEKNNTKEATTTLSKTTNRFKENYSLTSFNNDVKVNTTLITDGVTLVKNELHKTNGDLVIINCLEIDLNKVSIVAGTNNNETTSFNYTKATPYSMATAFENETNRKVYASINADFFGSTCVNAFVKDGYIIKNAHTTHGIYDYLNTESDLPASAPMLFGVNDNIASVGPMRSYTGDITDSEVKRKVVTSKLTYRINTKDTTMNSSASLNFSASSITLDKGSVYALVDYSNGVKDMSVVSINTLDTKTTLSKPDKNIGYIYAYSTNSSEFDFVNSFNVGDKVSLRVKSATNDWNDYDTIIGCRQALIIDGEIPNTVSLETSNGAKNKDIPRISIGVKEDGTVVIFAVESLYYNKKASALDSHGVLLTELAEFMYYYNIIDGANFDGGGSAQLIVREDDVFNKVIVRSSDTGSYNANESRKVMNSLLVTEKRK